MGYLGLETWPLAKVPEVVHTLSFYTRGWRNRAYYRSMGSGFQDMDQFSKLPFLIGHETWHWPKRQKLHIYPPSTLEGRT